MITNERVWGKTRTILGGFMLITLFAILLWTGFACNSSDSPNLYAVDHESDAVTSGYEFSSDLKEITLSNGDKVIIHNAKADSQTVTVEYTHQSATDGPSHRTLKFSHDITSMAVYDENGEAITGYDLTYDEVSGDVDFELLARQSTVTIRTTEKEDARIELIFTHAEESTSLVFDNLDHLSQAAELYTQVSEGIVAENNLTKSQRDLLKKARDIASWTDKFQSEEVGEDIRTARCLKVSEGFSTWLDEQQLGTSHPPGGDPMMLPRPLEVICKIIHAFKEICNVVGGGTVCEWVEVAEIICDLLEDILN